MAGADLLWAQPGPCRRLSDGSGLEYPGMCSAESNLALLPPTLEALSPCQPLPKKWVQNRLLFTRALVTVNNNSAPWCSSFPELPGSVPPGPVI